MNSSGFALRRVREEMIEKLLELGIKDFRVLDAISQFLGTYLLTRHLDQGLMKIDHLQSDINKQFLSLT